MNVIEESFIMMPELDSRLFGLWSADIQYGPGAQSDDLLIFKPDGTGRFEFINFVLCSADIFQWRLLRPGVLEVRGVETLQLSDDITRVERDASSFHFHELSYRIAEEDTPSQKRLLVLRANLGVGISDHYGLVRRDLTGCEEPAFTIK